jgi:3-hydroxy-9,10-secoandrosta-1,3,5(10)-triene-9,17-dione monooxygenase
VIEVARGCPSTGWWFALGAGHNAQISSYFSPEAQARIFGAAENFHAPWSFAAQGARIRPVEGGYRVSGKWMYCSGVPYASHFMGCARLPAGSGGMSEPSISVVVPRGEFTMLEDWGDLLGMKGAARTASFSMMSSFPRT